MSDWNRARARLAAAMALACGGGLALAAAQAGPPGSSAPERLPDLRAQKPAKLTVSSATRDGATRHSLGFRSAADNLGPGALVVNAERDPREPLSMTATQLVTRRDGSTGERPLLAKLRYVDSPDHSHWHYLGFMRYELRALATGRRVGADRKTGFCLGDRYNSRPGRVRGEPRKAAYDTNCALGRPDVAGLTEGISVGWRDDYDPYLEGQSIDITGLPAGRYRLVHTVNPDRTLAERSYANNRASVTIRITRGSGGPRLAPAGG